MPLILLPPSRLLSMGPGPLAGVRLQRRIDPRLRRKARSAVLGVVQGYACGGLGRLSCIKGMALGGLLARCARGRGGFETARRGVPGSTVRRANKEGARPRDSPEGRRGPGA